MPRQNKHQLSNTTNDKRHKQHNAQTQNMINQMQYTTKQKQTSLTTYETQYKHTHITNNKQLKPNKLTTTQIRSNTKPSNYTQLI